MRCHIGKAFNPLKLTDYLEEEEEGFPLNNFALRHSTGSKFSPNIQHHARNILTMSINVCNIQCHKN